MMGERAFRALWADKVAPAGSLVGYLASLHFGAVRR